MCGIAGFVNHPKDWYNLINAMNYIQKHRGPDGSGIWSDENHNVVLGHTRLSVLDLSKAGRQPMTSQDNRYTIVLNGEIYNHFELREKICKKCESFTFRGHSDTEILLEYIAFCGIEKALEDINGMYSMALYDSVERKITLARDRMGEKPLYYCIDGKGLVFSSEIRTIKEFYHSGLEVNKDAIRLYFLLGYIPAPYTVYSQIKKLPAAHYMSISIDLPCKGEPSCYWNLRNITKNINLFKGTLQEAVDELDYLLTDSIKMQMVADVPVGVFLSSGVDSSTIASIMKKTMMNDVKTFTIGFDGIDMDEAEGAKKIAEILGTQHYELKVRTEDIIDLIPHMNDVYGEPFADSSQFPTFILSRLTREHVTVALSGDGGDELFGGYTRYLFEKHTWDRISRIPYRMRRLVGNGISRLSVLNNRIRRAGYLIGATGIGDFDRRTIEWGSKEILIEKNSEEHDKWKKDHYKRSKKIEDILVEDMLGYLPDDILAKVDRASMANSLETRAPFLDKHIVEFALSLPYNFKADAVKQKIVLKGVTEKYLPRSIIDSPKKGFELPVDDWIRRGKLYEWGESLMEQKKIKDEGILNPDIVDKMWKKYKKTGENGLSVWYILMFRSWMENSKSIG